MTCMSEGRSLYRLFDPDTKAHGCPRVQDFNDADAWSEKKWGIFWTVNEFEGPRVIKNCRKVISWIIDLDDGTKEEQAERIRAMRLTPSAVIETKAGYHVYFDAIDGDPENYREIVERMVNVYGGDTNAKDLCRILRVPSYRHWKDPAAPFTVKLVFDSEATYTEAEITKAFPAPKAAAQVFEQKTELRKVLKFSGDQNLWERIWNIDCEQALARLSGTEAVAHEMFSFKRTSNGNLNIIANGKGTSCWIDQSKRIGSLDKGGPSIFQWINWYQNNNKRTVDLIKRYFPEVEK